MLLKLDNLRAVILAYGLKSECVKIFETNFLKSNRDPWRPPFLQCLIRLARMNHRGVEHHQPFVVMVLIVPLRASGKNSAGIPELLKR
ncbi:MAG: hypothetical protein DWI15_01800 [Planctomycetota bacterium]|nr:MAG: hypothetical protein DWI15_01800 [Planctomycetota bacterium]